jgi:trimeric autotransporter adhesin
MQAQHRTHSTLSSPAFPRFVSAALLLLLVPASLHAQRSTAAARALTNLNAPTQAVDTGAIPSSQPLTITLRLAPTPDRAAALNQLLANQLTPGSSSYHQWLTPEQYAASYGATDDQLASVTSWAQSQGLAVSAISVGKTRLTLTGSADAVQRAFATTLRNYAVSGQTRFVAATTPSVPLSVAPMIAGVSGLDNLPSTYAASISGTSVQGRTSLLSTPSTDPIAVAQSAIDANASPVLTFNLSTCSGDLAQSDVDAYQALFRQANAQGITVLATGSCAVGDASTSQPSLMLGIPEVTALTVTPEASIDSTLNLTEARPGWQVAPGLPADQLRHQPDLTASSATDFSQTMARILTSTGSRQGNVNATLYSLATTPDLYTQPDAATPGTWEPSTGLGVVDLTVLAKVFPRAGTNATSTSLSANSYAINYGDALTLTAKVLPSTYASANPTGTITFTASGQTLGSATIDSSGAASLNVSSSINVGVYSITASYSGDTNYAPSTSAPPIVVTVSIVNATLTAVISPKANVPYGSTATVTATVALPGPNAAPSGTVSAQIQGITGAVYTATLSPNPGGNTATANININAPKPQTGPYTVSVTCSGNQNFQCQSPATPTFTSAKGNTNVTISLTPAAPQAGQPVTITATVNNNGNGTDTYTFSGNIVFTDTTTGKTLATVPVGTNTAATSQTLAGNIQHNIVATYSGDANWNASASTPAQVTPTLLPSTLTITSNVTTALAGVNIVITATVFTTAANTVGPTGTVSFYDTYNGSIVQLGGPAGAITLTPNGPNQSIARFTTTGLLAGGHSIYAIYSGDANFAPATSSTLPLNLTDYNVIMNPQTLTLKAGQTGKVVMLIGSVGGFSGTVSFGCTPPASSEITCSFSQTTLQGGGTTTMTIVTTAAKAKPVQQALGGRGVWRLGAGSTLAMLVCFALPRRKRAMPLLLTSLLALSLAPALGCGAAVSSTQDPVTPTDPGTPLGTQSFTITTAGTDGVNTARHDYQYQVTIQ